MIFITIDINKLKQINNTLDHQKKNLTITLLTQTIKQSIHKNNYTIRLDNDKFYIILIDSTPQITTQLPKHIEKHLQHIAPQKKINFSSNIYTIKKNDTLHNTYKTSDKHLYINKQNKNNHS